MTSTNETGVHWNTVRRAIIFCNDKVKRCQLESEIKALGIPVSRGHEISQLYGLKFTLAIVINEARHRPWFSEAETLDVLGRMTHGGNQIVIM